MPETELPPGSGFAYDLGERILAAQSARADATDTKAAVVMAVVGVLAGFLFQGPFREAPRPVILMASVSVLFSMVTALGSFWTARYSRAPEFLAVTARAQNTESWLKWRFLPNLADAIAVNDRKLQVKVNYLRLAMVGLLVLILDIGGYLLYGFF
jgi:isoprenylcysteine carboxyl methyltransferase (ICMT) family protein YpbQ